jgi:hypothetical protein
LLTAPYKIGFTVGTARALRPTNALQALSDKAKMSARAAAGTNNKT